MSEVEPQVYQFEEFRIDSGRRLLTHCGEAVPLKPKVFDTLLYMARHPGRVLEKDELMREIWPDVIVEENNLNQNVSALRRALGENRGENRYIVTVPGRGYRFAAVVTAAAAGISNEETIGVTAQTTRSGKWRSSTVLAGVAVVLCLSLVAGSVIWRARTQSAALPPIRRIAILPFKPLMTYNRDQSLEVGMAETLIAKFSKIRSLSVFPLTAVRKYGGEQQDPFQAGEELRADAVLDGYIQRSSNRILVTTRLVRLSGRKQLWAGQFDEEAMDIFRVQDSITERVARELALELTSDERALVTRRYTGDAKAYELYLKGRFFWGQTKHPSIEKAIGFFQEAITRDPNYALAHSGIADCYRVLPATSDVASREAFPRAREAALKALELDGRLAEAHSVLGWIHLWYDWDWAGAESEFRRSLELDPSYIHARIGYAHLLSDLGRNGESLNEADRALRLDPISPYAGTLKGHFLYQAGRYVESIELLQKTLELAPDFWVGQITLGKNYEQVGRYEDALVAFRRAKEYSGGSSEPLSLIAYTYAVSKRRLEAERTLRELMDISRTRYVPPLYIAMVQHGLGNPDEALKWLEKAYAEKDVHMVFLGVDPKWNGLRGHPRFVSLLRRLKLQ